MLRLGIDDYIVKPFHASELRARVYNLLHNLAERRRFNDTPAEPDDIRTESPEAETFRERVRTFVLKRIRTMDVSVYDLAYELSMSERQLYRLSRSLTGCTPAQLVKEVRLQKAYELLLSGAINKLDDVAKQVGFEDANYFARQFHDRFGKRPTDFL
jgi:AraC-like DNA-binding protein